MIHNETAEYLTNLLPLTKKSTTDHNLRNKYDRKIPITRTSLYSNSFIPTATRKWNTLSDTVKQCGSLSEFKLKTKSNLGKIPKFFLKGNRRLQLTFSQLRMKCSPLKSHLANMHIIEDMTCDCGNGNETMEHYFAICTMYDHLRNRLQPYITLVNNNFDLLINGTSEFDEATNQRIFEAVSFNIENSKCFYN